MSTSAGASSSPVSRASSDSSSARTLAHDDNENPNASENARKHDVESGGKEMTSRNDSEKQGKKEQDNAQDPFLVTIKGHEHINPHGWGKFYRWLLTVAGGLTVMNSTLASSGPSQLVPAIAEHYRIGEVVGTLTIAIFVAGYCCGPLLWGPLSEKYGRKPIFVYSTIPYVGFSVGCALSPNIGALLAFRFLAGCCAAAPLTNVGGLIADLWEAEMRGIALAIFALAPNCGPAFSPIISGAFAVRGVNFRWIFWFLTIIGGAALAMMVFFIPETYLPILLHREAKRIRKETGDDRYYTEWENKQATTTLQDRLNQTLLKPFRMGIEEPMLLLLTFYLSLVYGILYLLFPALPLVFEGIHGWNPLEAGLVYLALPIGCGIGVVSYIFVFNKKYIKMHRELSPKPVPPEQRLWPLMYAAPMLVIVFFWFGWTSYRSINPVSPILAIVLFGVVVLYMFLSIFNYIIDTYLANAASALSFNTIVRSSFGAGFPLFATAMYHKLGVPGASSLLAGLGIVFLPSPFLLYKYGKKVRMMSKNAVVLDK